MIFEVFLERVAGGVFKVGDEVTILPSGFSTKIKKILKGNEEIDEAFHPLSVTFLLEDEIDVSRGDMIVGNQTTRPKVSQDIEAFYMLVLEDKKTQQGRKIHFQAYYQKKPKLLFLTSVTKLMLTH